MILITGDIHGSHDISKLDNTKNPIFKKLTKEDYLIICGDFGLVWYNDMADTLWRTWLDEKPFTTLFVDGNHENFDLLYEFPEEEWRKSSQNLRQHTPPYARSAVRSSRQKLFHNGRCRKPRQGSSHVRSQHMASRAAKR